MSSKHPNGNALLSTFVRPDIAFLLERLLSIVTVSGYMNAWGNLDTRPYIQDCFDTQDQARAAALLMIQWLGIKNRSFGIQDFEDTRWLSH